MRLSYWMLTASTAKLSGLLTLIGVITCCDRSYQTPQLSSMKRKLQPHFVYTSLVHVQSTSGASPTSQRRTQQPVIRTALGIDSFSGKGDARLSQIKSYSRIPVCTSSFLVMLGAQLRKTESPPLVYIFPVDEINMDAIRAKIAISYGEIADRRALLSS